MRTRSFLALTLLAISGASVSAQDPTDYAAYYPTHARGHVNTIFDAGGIDDINLFTGNLTLSVPLGPPLHPGGDLTFQLALHYNSSVWEHEKRCSGHIYSPVQCDQFGTGALLGAPDVGLGWSLEVGHISPRFPGELFLITPDGGEHQLFTSRFGTYDLGPGAAACTMPDLESSCYTRDGSDVKVVRTGDQTYRAHFPDGTTHYYTAVLDNYDEGAQSSTYIGRDYARQRDGTYCTTMEDRWGNRIEISYHTTWWHEAYNDATETEALSVVRQLIPASITEYRTDSTPLRHVQIELEHPANHPTWPDRTRPWRVSHVTFKHWDGGSWAQFLRYNLGYLSYEDSLPRLQLAQYYPWVGVDQADHTDWVYLLESLAVEGENLEYGFRYWTCADGADVECEPPGQPAVPAEDTFSSDLLDLQGMQLGTLRRLELPTGGGVTYDYGLWVKEHHTQDTTRHPEPPFQHACEVMSSVFCQSPGEPPDPPDCDLKYSYSLGVASRAVSDRGGAPLELKEYGNHSSGNLNLRVRFDAGDPGFPNPRPAYPHQPSIVSHPYATSYSKTTVTTHYVTDRPLRSDDSEYVFSLGTSVLDQDQDCGIDHFEAVTFPLSGALIYERHYRGSGVDRAPVRTVVHTYTVDDEAYGWASTGSRYGTQVNRRPREVITYHHGAAPGGSSDLVEVTRYGYESDLCSPSASACLNLSNPTLGYTKALPSHRTTVHSQTLFDSRPFTFSEAAMFAPLEDVDFDREDQTYYWKGGHDQWLLHRPEDVRVDEDLDQVVDLRSTRGWSSSHGELLLERVHFQPSAASDDKDVVTRYEYVTSTVDPGIGQVRRRLVGLWQFMEGSDLDDLAPDLSEYYEYDHATPVRKWLLCQEPEQSLPPNSPLSPAEAAGRCDGWQLHPTLGHLAEFQWERTLHPGWRLPTSSRDGSGDGVTLADYDGAGRLVYLEPTETDGADVRLSPTWITYNTPYEQLVSLWDVDDVVPPAEPDPQVVTRAVYDGLGRLSHLARRRALTTSPGYAEGDFRHKTYSYDGLGIVKRESDWTQAPIWDETSSTVVKRADPFGRPQVVQRSDGSITSTTYTGTRRVDVVVGVPDGEVLPQARTVTDLDARGNPERVLEEKDVANGLALPDPGTTDDFVISQYEYDAGDRLVSASVTGETAHEPPQQPQEVTQERSFTYDPRGFLTREEHPELGTGPNDFIFHCQHDAFGRPRRQLYRTTDCTANGVNDNVLDSYFDAAGRPRETWAKVGVNRWYVTSRVDYGVSAEDHSVGKPVVETQYTTVKPDPDPPNPDHLDPDAVRVTHVNSYRGPHGLLSDRRTEVRFRPDGSRGFQKFDTGYSYDRWGNVAQIRYPKLVGLSQCTNAPTVNFEWDSTGIREVSHLGASERRLLFNVVYDPATGMMNRWRTTAGFDEAQYVSHTVEPDETRARARRIQALVGGGTPLFDTGAYTWDALGNVLVIPGAVGTTPSWTYHYDALSRLEDATTTGQPTRQLTMDDFGNLIPAGMTADDVDATTNRLSASNFAYDDRGNLTQEPTPYSWTRRLRFDPLDRLVAVWGEESRAPAEKYAFAYDASGERVLRYRVDGTVVTSADFYLRDLSGNLLTELAWSPDDQCSWTRMGDWVYAGREPIVRLEPFVTSWRYVSLVTDHLGSVRGEVRDALQRDLTTFNYWPYGDMVEDPPTAIYEKHLFTAHEREYLGTYPNNATLVHMDYMHQREYTHRLGRFLSLDPVGGSVGSSQSWNRYSYVWGNPVNLVDPYGEAVYLVTYTTGNRRGDEEFRRAAQTRADEIRNQEGFDPENDIVLVRGVQSKADFAAAIDEANGLGEQYGDVGALSLFSHAGPDDGPVFHDSSGQASQFTASELGDLSINWEAGASAQFYGCNTADRFAQLFANEQGVSTFGYEGYAYFSSTADRRVAPQASGPLYMISAPGYRNGRLAGWLAFKRGRAFASPMVERSPQLAWWR